MGFVDSLIGPGLPATGDLLLLALVFATVFTGLLGAMALFAPADTVKRRLMGPAPRASLTKGADAPSVRSAGGDALERLDDAGPARLSAKGGRPSGLRLRLAQAGYRRTSDANAYHAARAVLALALPLVFVAIAPLTGLAANLRELLPYAAALALAGFLLPSVWVWHKARQRQQAASDGFPDVIDMLVVSVEAGLGFDAAIGRVAAEIGAAHPVLAEEFRLIGLELRLGQSRGAALHGLAERVRIGEVRSLVSLLARSERYGTSIGQTLRVYAAEMRSKRMSRAEEMANKLSVKLSIVLVLFTLPAMYAIILAPTAINILRLLFPLMSAHN